MDSIQFICAQDFLAGENPSRERRVRLVEEAVTCVMHQIEMLINEMIKNVDARCPGGSKKPHHLHSSPGVLSKFVENRCDRLAFLLCTGQRGVLGRVCDNENPQRALGQNRRLWQLRKGCAQLACEPVERAEE